MIDIKPYFLILENETGKLKFPEVVNVPKTLRPIFYKIKKKEDYFELESLNKTPTYKSFIEQFQKIVPELLRTSDKLSTIVSLSTVTEDYFLTFNELNKISKYLVGVRNSNPLPYFAIFVCSIALVVKDKNKDFANNHFLGSKEKVFLFVYENFGEINELEKEIIEFQEKIRFTEKYKKYSRSTYDTAIYDWVNELEKYPVDELQANRLINIENNLYNG